MHFFTIVGVVFAAAAIATPVDSNAPNDVRRSTDDKNWRDNNKIGHKWDNNKNKWDNDKWDNDKWDNNNKWDHDRHNNGGSGIGGNEEGPYWQSCTCTSGEKGHRNQKLGERACERLARSYNNLYWDGTGCVDSNGLGVERNGFERACKDANPSLHHAGARCK